MCSRLLLRGASVVLWETKYADSKMFFSFNSFTGTNLNQNICTVQPLFT